MTESELFAAIGRELTLDSAIALKPVSLPPFKPDVGPYHKVQYVIELVGKQFIQSSHAKALLEAKAKSGLGDPEIYVTVPGQSRWMALWTGDDALAYDSLAFAWDLISEKGCLSSATASELWKRAEEVAKPLSRRAIPLPPPDQVDSAAANLQQIKAAFDIGIDLMIDAPYNTPLDTAAAVEAAYAVGFRLGASGLLEWKQQGWQEPLLTILPTDGDEIPIGGGLSGLTIGFSFATSPAPDGVLERLFSAAKEIASASGARVTDSDGRLLSPELETELRSNLNAALDSFEAAGFQSGTSEAMRLFE